MPKDDIIEGLRYALSRGDSMESAMMTFYNSGYPKKDVEEAAYFLKSQPQAPTTQSMPAQGTPSAPTAPTNPRVPSVSTIQPPQTSSQPSPQTQAPSAESAPSQFSQVAQSFSTPKLSPTSMPTPEVYQIPTQSPPYSQYPPLQGFAPAYGAMKPESESTGRLIVILLVVILVFLMGSLVAVFLFRDSLSKFLGGIL